ncbi:hypothetical protein B566_EDAN012306 [Ephemera danica]|nr:hypothetical protein B566_EDAN012306 [Ephemera danica]
MSSLKIAHFLGSTYSDISTEVTNWQTLYTTWFNRLESYEMQNFYQLLPKVDAPHLYDNWQTAINHGEERTLAECFEMFKAVHALTTCPAAIKIATADVINEFETDGVIFLELRSTPREVPGKMTKEEYVEAIIEGILSHKGKIIVKLLLSIDRRQGLAEAEHTLQIALDARKRHPALIAGLDLSGDPTAGAVSQFLPTLQAARDAGLGIVIHCGEVTNEEEVMVILKFGPDRLGHATCVHPSLGGSETQWNALLKSNIPLELCLTSNIKCKTVPSYDMHHFKYLFEANYPIALCTDDKGVFCSDLSHEYNLAAKTFGLSQEQLVALSEAAIDFSLTSELEKSTLHKIFQERIKTKCS